MSTRKAIPKAEAIKLWTRAYGICSYPDCGRELVWGSESTRLRGEMAHVVASSAKWTRGDPTVDPDSLRRYENLILPRKRRSSSSARRSICIPAS